MRHNVLLSPKYSTFDFEGQPNVDQKIEIFEDRVLGWFLDVADDLVRRPFDEEMSYSHLDFAVLSIVSLYFEMIAQYIEGKNSESQSKAMFCKGLAAVFPSEFAKKDQERIYKSIRCALYHSGLTRGAIISRSRNKAIEIDGDIWVNTLSLVQEVKRHFQEYIVSLKESTNVDLRNAFEKSYNSNPKL